MIWKKFFYVLKLGECLKQQVQKTKQKWAQYKSMISPLVARRIDKRLNSGTLTFDLGKFYCDTDYMQIGGSGLDYLLNKRPMEDVKGLTLIENRLTAASISAFETRPLSQLVYLSLSWNSIGDEGCRWLSRGRLNCLATLELNGVRMGEAGLIHLGKASWHCLETISLSGNHLTGKCWRFLLHANWQSMAKINLYANNMENSSAILAVISEFKLKEVNISGQRHACSGDLKRMAAEQLKQCMTKRYGKHSVICNKA